MRSRAHQQLASASANNASFGVNWFASPVCATTCKERGTMGNLSLEMEDLSIKMGNANILSIQMGKHISFKDWKLMLSMSQ